MLIIFRRGLVECSGSGWRQKNIDGGGPTSARRSEDDCDTHRKPFRLQDSTQHTMVMQHEGIRE